MNHSVKITWIALLMTVASAGASAQSPDPGSMPRTRAEVRQELAEAMRAGTMAFGESGLQLRELFPGRYPPAPAVAGQSRAEVRSQVDAARRSGDLFADGEAGLKLNQLYPSRYAPQIVLAGRTRAQVRAELAEAQRTGDLVAGGEAGLTPRQMHPGSFHNAPMPMYAGAPASDAAR